MADRLRRVAVAGVLAASVVAGGACGARGQTSESTLVSTDAAAAIDAAILRTLDAALADAFVVDALAGGTAAGDAQPCLTADNRTSRRPSPLADPPYDDAAIAQRERTVRLFGAYAALLDASRGDAASADARLAAADFARAAAAASAAAGTHARGDLYVGDRTAALATLARDLGDARDAARRDGLLAAATPIVTQLLGVVRADAARRRLEALAATRDEERALLDYAAAGTAGARRGAAPIPCGRPLVTAAAPDATASPDTATLDGLPPGVRARVTAVRARERALAAIDLDGVFGALLDAFRAAGASPPRPAAFAEALRAAARASVGVAAIAGPLDAVRP